MRCRIEVDVVYAYSGPPDHPQLFRMLQQLGIRLHRGAHNERVRRFQLLLKLAVQLIRRKHSPAWFLQLLHGCC